MMAGDENSWDTFIRIFSEDPEYMKESPAYNVIVTEYGIPLMEKLVGTALNDPSRAARNYAAIVIQELTETDLIKKAYLDIHLQTLDFFRRSAIYLMVSNQLGSDLQDCGLLLTVDLVSSSLQHNDIDGWSELLQLILERGFSSEPDNLELILDVFCELRYQHKGKFVSFLEPYIMNNLERFINGLVNLLRLGEDCRVYMLLPSLHRLLSQRRWKELMGWAIRPVFFLNESQSSKRICAAENLTLSVHMSRFSFPPEWVPHSKNLIFLLFAKGKSRRGDRREIRAAWALWTAFASKSLATNYYYY